jgi:lipopolysaccharide/colanic/teichoic acid biosynthesis glycosyltransferase
MYIFLKRLTDIIISFAALVVFSPLLFVTLMAVYLEDKKNPIYFAPRVGKNSKIFTMYKIRSMVINADASGVDSTGGDDLRITRLGRLIRKLKIDELAQLLNVLYGTMSLVGPRPNVQRDVDLYTDKEKKLLDIKPGITDFSSVVFADESEILLGAKNPDLRYNQLIRPGKSRLGLFYREKQNILLDLAIVLITIVAIFSRNLALKILCRVLKFYKAPEQLIVLAKRQKSLVPEPPPGSNEIVLDRKINNSLE